MDIEEVIKDGLEKVSGQLTEMEKKHNEEIRNIGESHDETVQEMKSLVKKYDELSNRLDESEVKNNRLGGKTKTFRSELSESLEKSQGELRELKDSGRGFRIEMKNDPMTTVNTYTGEVVGSEYLDGVFRDPDRQTHVRQFLGQSTTTSNNIRYIRETGYTNGTAMQVEGGDKGNSSFTLQAYDAPVRTLASYLRISRQALDDTAFLSSYITQRLPNKLYLVEDDQILYGDNTGENLQGITGVAQAWQGITSMSIVSDFDVIVNAISQIRTDNGEYQANAVMLNPEDFYVMLVEKDQELRYYFPDAVRFGGTAPRIAGVPIIANTAVTKGDFIVGDFRAGATLVNRQGVSLQFFEQDQDNVKKNLVTVRVEERLALPIHNPNAFVYGDFATANP